ncbi:MAG: sulfur carrier protein ThiS [Hyphomicrobium sp.]
MTTGTREVLTVIVNGEAVLTAATTLADLVAERGLAGARVATARNGDFVPERARASTPLFFDDHIEIVSPRHGG